MAYVDFTTFTEVEDPSGGTWAQTTTRCTGSNIEKQENSYVYKDYGAGNFDEYTHWFDIRVVGTPDTDAQNGVWAVADSYGSFNTLYASASCQMMSIYYTSAGAGQYRIYLDARGDTDDTDYWGGADKDTTYYIAVSRSGSTTTAKIYPTSNDRTNDTNVIDTLSVSCDTDTYQYLQCGFSRDSGSSENSMDSYVEYMQLSFPLTVSLSDTINLSDEILFNQVDEGDSVGISDAIELNLSLEKLTQSDTVNLADSSSFLFTVHKNILNKINTIKRVLSDILNTFHSAYGKIYDCDNKINTLKAVKSNIDNDFRMISSFQQPGEAGFISLGKTYVKVYIGGVEQTDVDVDSITITQSLSSAHTASFTLGRAYDAVSKPSLEATVEIKYHIWTLYKGYITQIVPGDKPDSIRINCQDEYWYQNRTNKYFFVGHEPQDNQELYYTTISAGLSACGASFGIGGFTPQTMSLFGVGTSDAITQLTENSGNYTWFYHVDKATGTVSKKLWTSGQGDIIDLERQSIGTNLGLYQVLEHQITESVEELVNQFRVSMGDKVIRRFSVTGGSKRYSGYKYVHFYGSAVPSWNVVYEHLGEYTVDGQGVFHHTESRNALYDDVFTVYNLPGLSSSLEEWTDRYPPQVKVLIPFGGVWELHGGGDGVMTEGFTVDYEEQKLIFNEPIYLAKVEDDVDADNHGQLTAVRKPTVHLELWKKQYYSETDDPSDNPEDPADITSPLIFLTGKMGSYPTTITKPLDLPSLSIQEGGWYQDADGTWHLVPSWNDTAFASDYANWQLSKLCDKKYTGRVNLTIDAMCFYDIDLSNRIMIDDVLDTNLNIESITYSISSWQATINVTTGRYYSRDTSLPSHGQ